jgi:protein-disulfide isomerase
MFEKYQNFIAIVICGLLIGGGIILSKTIPQNNPSAQKQQTESDVKKELLTTAKKFDIDKEKLAACLDSGAKKQTIADAVSLAEQSGVAGTPTFFIIKRTLGVDDRIVSEKQFPIIGARDKATILKSIEDGVSPEGQPTLSGEKIVLSDSDHWLGSRRASTIIVMYSDIDCPFCKRAEPVIQEILAEHPEFGFVYRHSPIASLHPFATYKAEATCLGKMHYVLRTF